MGRKKPPTFSRRCLIETALAGAGLACGPIAFARRGDDDARLPLIQRAVPASNERLPVVGLGTNNYSVTGEEALAPRREVLRRLPELGGKVVDTAPAYGRSEEVIGRLIDELGNREELFLATKVTARNGDAAEGKAMLEESFRRLRTNRIDLMQVHNLTGAAVLIPVLREWKAGRRIRYVGITTSSDGQYEEMLGLMRRHPLDFIQVDYSIANRTAAEKVLPEARDRGMAVLINLPFGGRRGGNLFSQLANRPLPQWAPEIDATSWAQVLLKYCIAHPAVTCVIPGTTKPEHLEDNQRAARGRLPDAGLRQRMEAYWDASGPTLQL